jgi:phosphatidylglycerol:prolipoprotein diacylglycerol transferase
VKPVLTFGSRPVSSYKVMLWLGCVAGIFAAAPIAGERGLDENRFALAVVVLLIPALAGARGWYLLRHPGGRGGAAGSALFGGLVVAPLVSVPVLAAAGLGVLPFWDAASITMLVGMAFTRVGCLLNGCCGGREIPGRPGRYPTQLLEIGVAVVILGSVLALRTALPDGTLFAVVVTAYVAARVPLQRLRVQAARRAVGASSSRARTASSMAPWVDTCPKRVSSPRRWRSSATVTPAR